MKRENIRIRDPFILVEGDTYYMYGTTDLYDNLRAKSRFSVYTSRDLENFDGPFVVFDGERSDFWADCDYWAAEVWKYNDRFYLFGSFKAENHVRASQILVADDPLGPFAPISEKPQTPENWECLDGTLFCENGKPYMVFCHEWVQCGDGEMCAVELTPDLSAAVGEPIVLFRAGDNPFVVSIDPNRVRKITDGPFLFRENGKVKMIWSSMVHGHYAVLESTASSLFGEWVHNESCFDFDGGHAMIFTDIRGDRFISLHHPNNPTMERAVFLPIEGR